MSQQESTPRNLGMPVEMARQKVMMDPTAKEMAEVLGLTLEAFADRVVECAQHPDQIELEVMTPEEEEEFGDEIPAEAEVLAWLEAVDRGEIDVSDLPPDLFGQDAISSDAKQDAARRMTGFETPRAAPRTDTPKGAVVVNQGDPMGAALKNQLMLQRNRVIGQHPLAKRKRSTPKVEA